jgi:hypothetical protein
MFLKCLLPGHGAGGANSVCAFGAWGAVLGEAMAGDSEEALTFRG